ncbi:hypothetical protein Acy02nite_21980 [Actinoplanes cyaneus]|uniref:Uncharacterized protein n=1 Tax=Actinoplanes cyaneus TaxID=52696 RepID=A0A919IF79_9ACTN|nr:hypothetical protein Acy02nite_21980 [Actinoplanes cyaneus]
MLVTLTVVMNPLFQELVEQLALSSSTGGGGGVVFVTDGLGLADDFDGFGETELFEGLAETDLDGEGDAEAGADGETDGAVVPGADSGGSGTVVDSAACRSAEGCTIVGDSPADAVPPARTAMNTTRATRIAPARPKTPRAMKN